MNQFETLFASQIKDYYYETGSPEVLEALKTGILAYATANPRQFQQELTAILFDKDLAPLHVVMMALSKDTVNWGEFYLDMLNFIFDQAKQMTDPRTALGHLPEFFFIENNDASYIQPFVDRLYKELNQDNLFTKLAAISLLPDFIKNPVVRNRSTISNTLQQLLTDSNWKIRYVTFMAFYYADTVPAGQKLSLTDKIRKLVLGNPDPTSYAV